MREVYALGQGDDLDDGLTDEEREDRAALSALLDVLTASTGASSEGYVPAAVAVAGRPWTPSDDESEPGLAQPDVGWPGPALPGDPLGPSLGLSCLPVTSADTTTVLAAVTAANAGTPWVAADGSRGALPFRPLLPNETGCADLGT